MEERFLNILNKSIDLLQKGKHIPKKYLSTCSVNAGSVAHILTYEYGWKTSNPEILCLRDNIGLTVAELQQAVKN